MSTQADFSDLLQKSQELNLKYKTRIIEVYQFLTQLQNELNHEKIKARQYQNKFKDAVLQSQYSQGQDLIEKLNSKQRELIDCRKQIIDLNRRISNSSSSPAQTDLLALARQNEELMNNIQEIKSAAISAIMLKEQQIEEMGKTMSKFDLMESELKFQYDKYESLEREFDVAMREKEEDIRELNDKVSRQREAFLNKFQLIQGEASQSQNFKERLLEKTNDLEGTIEKSELIISEYQNKIMELQSQLSQQRLQFDKQRTTLGFEMQESKDQMKIYQREQKNLLKTIEDLKNKQKQSREHVDKLTQINQNLKHKLSIKKKKENKAIKDKITSSFAGVAKGNPVYASFAFRQRDSIIEEEVTHKYLGDFPEIQEVDSLIQNFNLEELGKDNFDEPVQKQPSKDFPISLMMTKKKTSETTELSKPKTSQATSASSSPPNPELLKQLQTNKQTILRLETEKKELQDTLNGAYNQLDSLNQNINNLTTQLQQERKNISELRQKLKKTKKESELTVEAQSLTMHVQKLQMDMIATKLKYAEEAEFQRQKYQRQKITWTQKLVQLTDQIAKQDLLIQQQAKGKDQKKKKKGFFG